MNYDLKKYDSIRPFEPEELPEVYDRLLANPQFIAVLNFLYPDVPVDAIAQKMRACKTNLEFQKAFCYDFIHDVLKKAATGCKLDVSALDTARNYTFMSNHRDIVLDSGILDVKMIDEGFGNTCEIAIGDNLLSLPWVKDLVRVNKSFIVQRGLSMRETLMASKLLSEYMHFAIGKKKEHIWIAQRQGRAKDSNDRTSETVLKMMAMAGEGSVPERLRDLHIVPLSISYEYDPCDFLKAAEMQQLRDDPNWEKGTNDDVISMQTGIMGYKGYVHYHCAPCIDDFLEQISPDMPKGELYSHIANHIDREIHRNYKLYPCNYIAMDMLHRTTEFADRYTADDKAFFEKYLAGQLAKIELANKDEAFLREKILTMYANPAINYLAVK